ALADPTSGPVATRNSTTLPCPAVSSDDRGITVTFPADERIALCTDASTGAILATFVKEPHSGLFFLRIAPPQVATSSQVVASGQVATSSQMIASSQVVASSPVAASCSCWSLSHQTVLWHHRLGHPSLQRLRDMSSQHLVSELPRVFASLPPSPALPCTPCVEGRLCATPHSSSLRPATAPF
ncbi:unnamed protein product, partial [Closterium sp. NIES-54]